jgi:hypothetical protein
MRRQGRAGHAGLAAVSDGVTKKPSRRRRGY